MDTQRLGLGLQSLIVVLLAVIAFELAQPSPVPTTPYAGTDNSAEINSLRTSVESGNRMLQQICEVDLYSYIQSGGNTTRYGVPDCR